MTQPVRTIRTANPSDAETIAAYNQHLAWETESIQLDEATIRDGVAAVLEDRSKGVYFVVEEAGTILGQCLITYEWSDWRNGFFWWIQSVYVVPQARRQGVFRSLYQHLVAEATQRREVIGIRLYVERENKTAQATYQGLGMHPEDYNMMALYPLPGRASLLSHPSADSYHRP